MGKTKNGWAMALYECVKLSVQSALKELLIRDTPGRPKTKPMFCVRKPYVIQMGKNLESE